MNKTLNNLIVAFSVIALFSAAAYAQGPKEVAKAAIKTQAELYKWSTNISKQVTQSLERNTFGIKEPPVSFRPSSVESSLRHFLDLGEFEHALRESRQNRHNSVEAKVMQSLKQEAAHYRDEITAARGEIDYLKQVKGVNSHVRNLNSGIKSPALRDIQEKLFEQGDAEQMIRELTDYYDLENNPVESSASYIIRHPHKLTLFVRKMLRSPLVDDELKDELRAFLEKDAITTPEEEQALRETLTKIYNQQTERMVIANEIDSEYAAEEQWWQQKHDNYARGLVHGVLVGLQRFVAKEGRLPETNSTRSHREHNLATWLDLARYHLSPAAKEAAGKYFEELQQLVQTYQKPYWTKEETRQKYRAWHACDPEHNIWPRNGRFDANASPEETELEENLMHHNMSSSALH